MKRLLSAVIAVLISFPTVSYAAEGPMFQAPDKQIWKEAKKNMISVKSEDVENVQNIANWLSVKETFIFERKNKDGKVSYFFNAPNLQSNIINDLTKIDLGGWKVSPSEGIKTKESEWTTAEKKYGWEVPDIVYVGENPVVTLDTGVITNQAVSPTNTVKVFITGAFEGIVKALSAIPSFILQQDIYKKLGMDQVIGTEFTAGLTPEAIKSLEYENVDYTNTAKNNVDDFGAWLKEYWPKWKADKDNIGFRFALNENLFDAEIKEDASPLEYMALFINKTGASYKVVLEQLDAYNKSKGYKSVTPREVFRDMPYDLDTMSPASKSYMKNISDPRTQMAKSGIQVQQAMFSTAGKLSLGATAALLHLGSMMNSVCSFDFLESQGVKFADFWKGSLGTFIVFLIALVTIIAISLAAVKAMKSKQRLFSKVISIFVLGALALGLAAVPDQLAGLVTGTMSKIMNASSGLMTDKTFDQLHTDNATPPEKSSLRYWYMNYAIWGQYSTGHRITDDASAFDISQKTNEYYKLTESPAKLAGGKQIDSWNAVLLEYYKNNDHNGMYRVADHFLAPTVKTTQYPQFEVSTNKFYNGYMFKDRPYGAVAIAAAVLIFTALKFLSFVELIIDIIMFFFKIVMNAFSGIRAMKSVFKGLGEDLLRVIAYDVLVTICLWTGISFTIPQMNVFGLLELFIACWIVYKFIKGSRSILAPSLILVARNKIDDAKHVARAIVPSPTDKGTRARLKREMNKL